VLPRRLRGLPVAARCAGLTILEASTCRARLLGLALVGEPPNGVALHIPRCRSVHTFGMRFALDVAFLDVRGRTIRTERAVPPRRVLVCRGARSVLEVPSPSPSPRAARAAASAP
jgi:uncharacterized membrane protein (UPF0127 family)